MFKRLNKIKNSSHLVEGFTYDREPFNATSTQIRSLLSGAFTTGLLAAGVYTSYMASSAEFALHAQAFNFKLAVGSIIGLLGGYSLRDLHRSITDDTFTALRAARANDWLANGTAVTSDLKLTIELSQAQLKMTRMEESESGIIVYAFGKDANENKFLVEAFIPDTASSVAGTAYLKDHEIRSLLRQACGEYTADIAPLVDFNMVDTQAKGNTKPIVLPSKAQATRIEKPQNIESDEPLDLGDDFLRDMSALSQALGRQSHISSPLNMPINMPRS